MIKIMLCGCSGRMGRFVADEVAGRSDCVIAVGTDIRAYEGAPFQIIADPVLWRGKVDVIVDFSNPSALYALLGYARKTRTPAVIATTGFDAKQLDAIKKAAKEVPIFYSPNMSLGVSLVTQLAWRAAEALGGSYDIEIVEAHHNQKLDAPSGTALLLADAVSDALPEKPEYVYDRHAKKAKRSKNEIGIHSVRGGTITGEHTVIFAGENEVITISHSAQSRQIFAAGAVNAALFLVGKDNGLYTMKELLG